MKKVLKYILLWFMCASAISSVSVPALASAQQIEIDSSSMPFKNAFQPIYIGGGLSKVSPVSIAENAYVGGATGSNIHYRFFLHDKWVVSVAGGFKILTKEFDGNETFVTFAQESQRLFRIYHPFWLAAGTKAMYIACVEKIGFPFERNTDQPPQVGAGIGMSLYYLATPTILVHGDLWRWRGTATNRMHVLEIGLGVNFALTVQ